MNVDKKDPEYLRHKEFLSRRNFAPRVSLATLSQYEIDIIHKYGYWMNAVSNGELKPVTVEQERFLDVCKGNKNAVTNYEITWKKYLDLIEERECRQKSQLAKERQFHESLKGMSDKDLKLLFDQNLNMTEMAYVKNEWRSRFPDVSGEVHATTDGQ